MTPDVGPPDIAWVGIPPDPSSAVSLNTRAQFPFYEANYARWLPARRDARILDYGFGEGTMLRFLHEQGYTNLAGVDRDARFAAYGQHHLPATIMHTVDPLVFLRAHRNRYDFVIAMQVAYYIPRDSVAEWFRALAETLTPGGRLLVEAFNGAVSSASLVIANDPYIRNAFTEHSLRWALEFAGLDVTHLGSEIYPRGGVKRALWLSARMALNASRRLKIVIDRGVDPLNPTLLGKHLIAIGDRPLEPPAAR